MTKGLGFGTWIILKKSALCLAFCLYMFAAGAAYADCPTVTMGNKPTGYIFHNADYDVLQVCRSDGTWQALGPIGSGPPDPCAGTPSPGDVCADGSVYAGLSPDGNVPMYTTPADEGSIPWNNGNTSGHVMASQTNLTTGETNTGNLIGIDSDSVTGGTQPHLAAQTCADLSTHGHSDWYLPARDELNVLYTNNAAIGGFDTSGVYPGGRYFSSSETNDLYWLSTTLR